ncbi:hypothetical protein ACJX0J_020080, partial [Zea mays]
MNRKNENDIWGDNNIWTREEDGKNRVAFAELIRWLPHMTFSGGAMIEYVWMNSKKNFRATAVRGSYELEQRIGGIEETQKNSRAFEKSTIPSFPSCDVAIDPNHYM